MGRNANQPQAFPINDWNLDAPVFPQPALQTLRVASRQLAGNHRAKPVGVIWDQRRQLGQTLYALSRILSKKMSPSAKLLDRNLRYEVDRRRHAKIRRVVARAGPVEFVS